MARSLEGILRDLEESESRTSFLPRADDRQGSPEPETSYKLQLEHLETKLREFAALVRVRDRELDELYREQSLSPVPASESEGSPRLFTLEDERQQSLLQAEADRLRGELSTVNCTVSSYERKLLAVHSQLQAAEGGRDPRASDLIMRLSAFLQDNGDLREQVERARQVLSGIEGENRQIQQILIPDLETDLRDYETRRDETRKSIARLKSAKCNLASGVWTQRTFQRLPQSSAQKCPTDRPAPPKRLESPRPKREYAPSFLRSMRPTKVLVKRKHVK